MASSFCTMFLLELLIGFALFYYVYGITCHGESPCQSPRTKFCVITYEYMRDSKEMPFQAAYCAHEMEPGADSNGCKANERRAECKCMTDNCNEPSPKWQSAALKAYKAKNKDMFPESTLPPNSTSSEEEDTDGLPIWFWILGAGLVAVAVLILAYFTIVYIRKERKKQQEQLEIGGITIDSKDTKADTRESTTSAHSVQLSAKTALSIEDEVLTGFQAIELQRITEFFERFRKWEWQIVGKDAMKYCLNVPPPVPTTKFEIAEFNGVVMSAEPLREFIGDFWEKVLLRRPKQILMINSDEGRGFMVTYFPRTEGVSRAFPLKFNYIIVLCKELKVTDGIQYMNLDIRIDFAREEDTMEMDYYHAPVLLDNLSTKEMETYLSTRKDENGQEEMQRFLPILNLLNKLVDEDPRCVWVHCKDGRTHTGVIAFALLIMRNTLYSLGWDDPGAIARTLQKKCPSILVDEKAYARGVHLAVCAMVVRFPNRKALRGHLERVRLFERALVDGMNLPDKERHKIVTKYRIEVLCEGNREEIKNCSASKPVGQKPNDQAQPAEVAVSKTKSDDKVAKKAAKKG